MKKRNSEKFVHSVSMYYNPILQFDFLIVLDNFEMEIKKNETELFIVF